MNRRGLIISAVLVASLSMALSAVAQESRGPRSLLDRIKELRGGWGRDSQQAEAETAESVLAVRPGARQTQQAVPAANRAVLDPRDATPAASLTATSGDARYPHVNSSQLLPNNYARPRRRMTATVPTERRPQPREKAAEQPPQTAARTDTSTADPESTRTAALPKSVAADRTSSQPTPRTLGDAYLHRPRNLPLSRLAEPADEPAPSEPKQQETMSAPAAATSSRPSPVVRRTPRWTPPEDVDPDVLDRDVVDSADRSRADQNDAENDLPDDEELAAAESIHASDTASPQSITGLRSPVRLGPPESADTENQVDAAPYADAMPTPRPQSPAAEATELEPGNLPDYAQTAEEAGDAERVQEAGQRAFANHMLAAPQTLPPAQQAYQPATSASGPGYPPSPGPMSMSAGSAYSRESFLTGQPTPEIGGNVLASNRMPMISSNVSGPSQILIGREAHYKLHLSNQSNTPAQQVVAEVRVPEWAEVVDTSATSGIIQLAHDADEPNTFRWQLQRLAAQGNETLEIKLIPHSSRPLELGVDWSYAPVGARAIVEVQEPKLRMHVSGPDEVLYGKPQLYRITLTNPGTGLAENVEIHLLPPGGGEEAISSHLVGELPPGTSKSVEVELTAREAGKLYVKASATAAGGISAEGEKDIFCRKPELEVDWRGPEQKYAGTVATYYFRVRNPGTAAAEGVSVGVRLPEGVELLTASDGQVFDPDQSTVLWRVGTLRPGDDYYMELQCRLNTAGINALEIKAATDEGLLTDAKSAETNVVALADLKLDVSDPQGPVPVGQEAVYEIRVRNRGTNVAEQVNIVALFSEGIDAESVEGAQYTISDGRVTFRTIEKLAAGRELVLKIRARAKTPGTHVFRAEVLCRDLEIQLAAEETTRFFQDESFGGAAGLSDGPGVRSGMFQDTDTNGDADGGRY